MAVVAVADLAEQADRGEQAAGEAILLRSERRLRTVHTVGRNLPKRGWL